MKHSALAVGARFALLALVFISLLFSGCTSPPPDPPPAPRMPAPEPDPPEPEPEPAPQRTAPLVGTLWELRAQFGSEDVPRPPEGSVQLRFEEVEDRFAMRGPVNEIVGTYRYEILDSTLDNPNYEEGRIAVANTERTRQAGRYIRYEDIVVRNLGLIQGYYITDTPPSESELTLFGGHGREEIILFELKAVAVPE